MFLEVGCFQVFYSLEVRIDNQEVKLNLNLPITNQTKVIKLIPNQKDNNLSVTEQTFIQILIKVSMGGSQGAIFQQGEPLSNYDVVQKVPEHNISYLKHKTNNKEYMIREFAINDKTEFAQTCEKIKNRKKMESQFLTKLERFSEQLEDNMCSSFYKIYAMWEYPTHTLADEVNERALSKRRFTQNELFSILASVFEGMSCLQSSGVKHECLTTSSILFDETGTVKVADPLTSIAPSNFDRSVTNRKVKGVYISPEQCESLKNQRPIPNRNPYKSDVFIFGIIILECGLLEEMDSIFVDNFEDVDLEGLNQKLELFGKIYSKDLKLTVSTMLTRDPKERMDWIGLKQYVPQKNDSDANKQVVNPSPILGYKPQVTSQPATQHFPKLTLGGGSKPKPAQTALVQQPVLSHLPKYQPEPLTNYISPITQTNPPLNPSFGQPIQSFSYQPPTGYTATNFGSSTQNSFGYSGLSSNLYSNPPKVSNYIVESKASYERPTEEFLASNNVSKLNSGVPATLIDRDSSSFPLNSQLEFKKDYIIGIGHTNPQPSYDYHSSSTTQHVTESQQPYQSSYYSSLPYTPSSIPSSYPGPQAPVQTRSFFNQKTQLGTSQSNNSPLLSHHVKDAKSITYDKGLYSSYITEEKSHTYVQEIGQQQNAQHYSTIVTGNNPYQELSTNGNTYSSNFYQPINKPVIVNHQQQIQPHYVSTPTPVLYQPLSTASGVKEKPIIPTHQPQPMNFSATEPQRQSTNPIFNNTATLVTQQQQTYQYKQIHHQPQSQPSYQSSQHSSQPASSSQLNSSTAGQELEYVIEHFKQGSRYQGTKYQDMRHGQGKFFYQDGGMYQGNWKFNKMDGYGKLYYQSGKIAYEGNWTEDQFQGFGKLYNQQCDQLNQPFDYQNFDMIDEYWMYYEGNFMADQKDGEGKMVFSNGEYFVGSFQKDMVDGPGEFHRMNGDVVKGVWNQNQLVQVQE